MAKQKTVLDYYELIFKEYPNIPKSDIKRILQYGWKAYYRHNNYGGDVLINRLKFWFYSGRLMNNSLSYFNYYIKKMRIKLRIMYKRLHIPWDGYYYFALSRNQYEEYLSLKKKKGRPKKWFTFNKVILYKIYDECNIAEHGKVAIFRVPLVIDKGLIDYKLLLETDKAELVLEREPLTFNDILLSEYAYQFIPDYKRKYKHKENE